jgi:hypothetical protein
VVVDAKRAANTTGISDTTAEAEVHDHEGFVALSRH